MKVLLSAPRAGSSFCYESFHSYNLALPNVKYIGVEEYLDPAQLSYLTLEDKIKFLNSEKEKGINYTFKHHINYLGDYYKDWFLDFYKDDDVYILKRKDVWKWFLSFLYQDCVSWSGAALFKTDNVEHKVAELSVAWKEYDHAKSLAQFFSIKQALDNTEGTVIYYEDLTHTSKKYIQLSTVINYESVFANINIIKKDFLAYINNDR